MRFRNFLLSASACSEAGPHEAEAVPEGTPAARRRRGHAGVLFTRSCAPGAGLGCRGRTPIRCRRLAPRDRVWGQDPRQSVCPLSVARWVSGDPDVIARIYWPQDTRRLVDRDGRMVMLFGSGTAARLLHERIWLSQVSVAGRNRNNRKLTGTTEPPLHPTPRHIDARDGFIWFALFNQTQTK